MSWNFLCADMFPYEDSKIVSVCQSICPYPEKRNLPSFVNISPIVELIHQWKGLHEYYSMKTHKFDFLFKICWNLILICSEKLPCIITSFFHASTFINFFLYISDSLTAFMSFSDCCSCWTVGKAEGAEGE